MKCENCEKLTKKLKKLIMQPLFIDKDEADFLLIANKKIRENEALINKLKRDLVESKTETKNIKQDTEKRLNETISILSKEYTKVIKEWYKLKYGDKKTS